MYKKINYVCVYRLFGVWGVSGPQKCVEQWPVGLLWWGFGLLFYILFGSTLVMTCCLIRGYTRVPKTGQHRSLRAELG